MYVVELMYEGPPSTKNDQGLEQLAQLCSGRWFASGTFLSDPTMQRDIEFWFPSEATANAFLEYCGLIPWITVITPVSVETVD